MRILHVGKYYPPVKGGMETVLRHLCEGMLARGHSVSALVAGTDRADRVEQLGPIATGASGRLLRAGSLAVISSQPLTPTLPSLLRRELLTFQPHILHLHLPNPIACAVCLALLPKNPARRGPRLAVWYHADITRQRFGGSLVQPLVKACLTRAAGVCVSSDALRDHSQLLSRYREKVDVIPFGIDTEEWEAVRTSAQGPFLFVGRLVYYKGLSLLLRAMAGVPEAELVIVGSGPLRNELIAQSKRENLQGRVHFAGELADDHLRDTMSTARALILPSTQRSEAFGLVQLEAMAAGLPVISTSLPTGIAEVNVDGVTGRIVPPADVEALVAAITELQVNPALVRNWGESGRRHVRERFERENMIEKLETWYSSLLESCG